MEKIDKLFKLVERFVVLCLLVFMAIVIVFSTIELAIVIFSELVSTQKSDNVLIDINNLSKIFGFFLNVLIGLELFETVKLYLKESVFHGEVILLVGLIAISRKVIILDYQSEEPMMLIAIAVLIAAISLGYYFVKNRAK